MATTPQRSLKRRLAGTVEGRTPRFLLGSLALAMVISLLAGIGIGMKVEQHRVKTKSAGLGLVPKKQPVKQPVKQPIVKIVRGGFRGTVDKVTSNTLVVFVFNGRKAVALAPLAVIERTAAATVSDFARGDHVLTVSALSTGATTSSGGAASGAPHAIIVVKGKLKNRLGRVVTAVTPTSVTFTLPNGKSSTVSTVGVTLLKTVKAARSDLKQGRSVIVRTSLLPPKAAKNGGLAARVLVANEVLILPTGTPVG